MIEGTKRNPTESWQRTLYKAGKIDNAQLEYNFHGVGCWVKWNEKIIDFDFKGDPEKGIWGIDTWFCAYYLQSLKKEGFNELDICQNLIRNELEKLEKEDRVVKYNSVYFFIEDFKELQQARSNKN